MKWEYMVVDTEEPFDSGDLEWVNGFLLDGWEPFAVTALNFDGRPLQRTHLKRPLGDKKNDG